MKIHTFKQSERYLNSLIKSGSKQLFQGEKGIFKMRYFLSLIDSPQNKLKIIHIAGTSGKGSTCYLISRLLSIHGFKTGLHLSPHLVDIRERFQINNKKISKKKFIFYLNKLIPAVEKTKKIFDIGLSYFEVLVGLVFYIFKEEKVDYVVIETGLGGLYDATNVVDREDKISVITKIGFDHMEILGDSLDKIAFQKGMIINKNSVCFSTLQNKEVKKVLIKIAKEKNAELKFVKPLNQKICLYGDYQKENAALALEVLKLVSKREGFDIKSDLVRKVFKNSFFIGRFDIKKIGNKKIILDGAHNPQKMKAFISALKQKFPEKKFNFLVAFKKNKNYKEMLDLITPLSFNIIVTSFFVDNQDLIHLSEDPKEIVKYLDLKKFKNYKIIEDNKKAFIYSFKNTKETLIITGSFYLLGEIYKFLKIKK